MNRKDFLQLILLVITCTKCTFNPTNYNIPHNILIKQIIIKNIIKNLFNTTRYFDSVLFLYTRHIKNERIKLVLSRKLYLYIRNLKYCTFNTIFQQHNIYLVFSTYQQKYKWILCTEKPVLNVSFQDF